jgi:hypothetical protein
MEKQPNIYSEEVLWMRKMLLFLLVPLICSLIFIALDQYTKYALKAATIKFTKEYCNADIAVREIEINRIDFSFSNLTNWGSKPQWVVKAEPSKYSVSGNIRNGTYIPWGSGCLREVIKIVKLDRLKREFVPR